MTNALTAADSVLIPLCPEFYSTEGLVLLVERHDAQLPPRSQVIRRWLGRLGPEAFFQLLEVKRADSMGQDLEKVRARLVELDEIKAKAEQILAEGQCFTLKDLAVDGRDVMAAGVAPDPEVGRVLGGLLERVLSGEIPNERNALLKRTVCNQNNGQE